jgi:hypothetical protein
LALFEPDSQWNETEPAACAAAEQAMCDSDAFVPLLLRFNEGATILREPRFTDFTQSL